MKDTLNAEAEASGPHMQPRIAYHQASPKAVRPLWDLEEHVRNCGLEPGLIELVKLRASQINGCAYCLDMHWKDLRVLGETEQRLYSLDAWRECPYYTERERAALAWTEAVTLITDGHVPDEVYAAVSPQFTEKELADLTLAVAARAVGGERRAAFAVGLAVFPERLAVLAGRDPHHQDRAVVPFLQARLGRLDLDGRHLLVLQPAGTRQVAFRRGPAVSLW